MEIVVGKKWKWMELMMRMMRHECMTLMFHFWFDSWP